MKKITQKLLRFGAITLTLGVFSIARADTQNEKGNAGDDIATAEGFDCRKDKWVCTHFDADDTDLLCFYWPGGPFTCKGKGLQAGYDVGICLIDGNGTCWGDVDAGGDDAEETLTIANLAPGKYYIYCGHYNSSFYENATLYGTEGGGTGGYCFPGTGGPWPIVSPSGTFFKCKIDDFAADDPTPGDKYECCIVGFTNNPGVPFQQAAKAGKGAGSTKGGKVTKIMSSQKKAKFFCSCDNPTGKRGATGVQFRGVSKSKFKQKYIDIATGENMTAEVIGTEFCKNYDPGFKQTFKCVMKPKGRFKKMDNVKSKCIIDCVHDAGVNASSQKVKFTANMDKKKKN